MKNETDKPASRLAGIIGDRIRDLRRRRHITQVELARRIGMRPGPLNTIEKGRHVPSGRVLFALSRALDVSLDEIFPPRLPLSSVDEAAAADIDPADIKPPPFPFLPVLDTEDLDISSRETVNELAHAFIALEDLCSAMKCALVPLYIPFVADESGIERLANQVRHHMGITNAVVFDYLELMENSGLRVVFCDLPGKTSSVSAYDRQYGNAFFFINAGLTVERCLFRLLFELGRIYWHTRKLFSSVSEHASAEELDEVHMARKFAAFFLMPATAVRSTVEQIGVGPSGWTYELLMRVKHRFGVSAESFSIRLEELGLIEVELSNEFKTSIRAHYSETGYKEPSGSMRRLMPNGRLGDLLTNALTSGESKEEALEVKGMLDNLQIKLSPDDIG